MKINFLIIAKILFLSALIGALYNFLSDDGLPLFREKTELVAASDSALFSESSPNQTNKFAMISTEQAYELYNSEEAIFIDARDQWDFAEGHIPASINIPEFSFEPDDSLANSLNKSRKYVIYCHGDDCDVAIRLAKELKKIGFKNLFIYSEGWVGWVENGYAVETGEAK